MSIQELAEFLDRCPTAWQAVDFAKEKLADFQELESNKDWDLKPGARYIVTQNGSTLAAFIMPKKSCKKVKLLAAHTDSPSFKLKPHGESIKEGMTLWSFEVYGAPLLNSWLNRDLGIAGRIVFEDYGKLKIKHVVMDHHPITIPQLAIHLDRDISSSGLLLNPQEHLNALVSMEGVTLASLLSVKNILTHDLFLYPLEKARLSKEFLTSYRLDNLASVHAALNALKTSESSDSTLKMVLFWDHEEIGSKTAQGAESPFALHLLERLVGREALLKILPSSLTVSVDLAHALHPNYLNKHDPQHAPKLGGGVVIKWSAQGRYATDAETAGQLTLAAKKADVPLQNFVIRSDMKGGSTIGPAHATRTGMPTIDIGSPMLSMHSARELISIKDHLNLCKLLKSVLDD